MPASTRAARALRDGERPHAQLWEELRAGGPAGNGILTAIAAMLLLGLLAAEGVTIVRIGQLLWEHLFIGMVLIPVVALKLASTGYRFVRYYTGSAPYVRKGPPPAALRLSAPLLVLSSVVVLGSGVWLLFAGPGSRDTVLPVHKLTFFAWLALMALHVLGHVVELPPALRAEYGRPATGSARAPDGRVLRQLLAFAAIAAGVLLAVLVIGDFAPWLHARQYHHGH